MKPLEDINLVVLFLQYDTIKYPRAYQDMLSHINKLSCNKQIIIIDNKADDLGYEYEKILDSNTILISGDNLEGEFSGWDKGIQYIRDKNIDYDMILFINDSFMNLHEVHSPELIINDYNLYNCMLTEYVETSPYSTGELTFTLNDIDVSSWFRTHCFIFHKNIIDKLEKLTSFNYSFLGKCFTKESSLQYFKEDAPLNKTLQDFLIDRIKRRRHTTFNPEDNWNLFKRKMLGYFNEMMLTHKLSKIVFGV